jgi:hypothetical protein
MSEIKGMLRTGMEANQKVQSELESRLKSVERRQWISVGAAMAGGFIIGTFLEILSFFS